MSAVEIIKKIIQFISIFKFTALFICEKDYSKGAYE
jgi:hypothetical protein